MMNIKSCGSEKNDSIDRISGLPDDVRKHILYFLTTREAVQTCILSKRWVNTWTSLPDLEFDIAELGLRKIFNGEMAIEELVAKFKLLVKSVLEKRETSCVNIFQLYSSLEWGGWPCAQAIADCIGDVIKLRPREFFVEMGPCKNFNLITDLIFTCASLIHLQLGFYIRYNDLVDIEPNSVNLPCLKTLNLDCVAMSDDSLKKLLLGCPVLEELVLESFCINIIEICSNTLKKLVLHSDYTRMRVQISTPNLLYLDIEIIGVEEIMLLNMPSLIDASIYIAGWYDHDKYVTSGPKLIHNLSNVESLRLELGYLRGTPLVQKKDFSSCPVFYNLKHLEIVSWYFCVFDLPSYFLHHSPKLQELTLEYKRVSTMEFVDEEITKERMGDALVQREFLKKVRIVGFKVDSGFVDQLINKLLAHVKIIGDICY